MSLIDALAIVSCVVAVGMLAMVGLAALVGAVMLPLAVVMTAVEREWHTMLRVIGWWLASLAVLVVVIWIDGNVEPWWP